MNNLHNDLINQKYNNVRKLLIKEIQQLLMFESWSDDLLKLASANIGLDKSYYLTVFPNKVKDALHYFELFQDELMIAQLHSKYDKNHNNLSIREKIAHALIIRIKSLSPIIHAKNAAYFSMPQNILFATNTAWHTCDSIWSYINDISTDFNYYTKRSLLLSVYLSSIMFYISDESLNYIDTENFIKSSLESIVSFFALKNKIPNIKNIPILRMLTC